MSDVGLRNIFGLVDFSAISRKDFVWAFGLAALVFAAAVPALPPLMVTPLATGLCLIVLAGFAARRLKTRTAALTQRSAELEAEALSLRAQVAVLEHSRTASMEYGDHVLRRTGAELHDGAAQLIGISLLRLDAALPPASRDGGADDVEAEERAAANLAAIRQALTSALTEIRNLSQGLVLPEIEALSLADAARLAAGRHEQHTGTGVQLTISELPDGAPGWLKRYVYRFVQEGLMNAFRHAGGMEQAVDVRQTGGVLEVQVSDRGAGIQTKPPIEKSGRVSLGLEGLRERAGAIGAVIDFQSTPGAGTRMTTRIPFAYTTESCGVSEV